MAVAVLNVGTLKHATTSPLSQSFTVSSGSSLVAIAVVGVSGSSTLGAFTVSATLGGVAMTACGALEQGQVGAAAKGVQAFYLVAPSTGTPTLSVTASQSGGTIADIYANVIVLSGANQGTPIRPGSFISSAATVGSSSTQSISSSVNDITFGLTGSQAESTLPSTNQTLDGAAEGGSMDFGSDHCTTRAATITDNWTYSTLNAGYVLAGFSVQPQLVDDASESWWVGVQQCGAVAALAAGLALTASASLAQHVANQPQDEVFPAPQIVDEDYWQNQVPPAQLTFQVPAPWSYEQNEVIYIAPTMVDEDYWQNSVPPGLATFLAPPPWSYDQNETAVLHGQPDEDFWMDPVAPVQAAFLVPPPWQFEQNEQAFGLYGQPDEDFWRNPVFPVPLSFQVPAPWQWEQNETPTLHGQMDEDFWQNPVAPTPLSFAPLYLPDPEVLPGLFYGQPDEDFWANPVPPVPLTFARLYLPEPEEIPAGLLHGEPDEDFWVNPIPPVPLTFAKLYLPDPEELPAGFLHGQPDEDFWQNPVPPVPLTFAKLYLPDPEEIPAAALHIVLNEDFWMNPVPPVRATFYQRLPLGGQEELPNPTSFVIWIQMFPT